MIRRTLEEMDVRELLKKAASLFQECTRAEFGASVEPVYYTNMDGNIQSTVAPRGVCVCSTCGRRYTWKGSNQLDGGHVLAGRTNRPSTILNDHNCLPQCSSCNGPMGGSKQHLMEKVCRATWGDRAFERLRLYHDSKQVMPTKTELISKIKEYRLRIKQSIEEMEG